MTVLAGLLAGDELVIVSLGSSVDEWYNAAPAMRSASLFQQQLGCVTPEALGGPPTHTASGRVDLAAIARGAGVTQAHTARTDTEFAALAKQGLTADAPFVIVAKVDPSVPPDIRRKQSDGREDKYIFVRHVEETEGIVIMGPSEHN
jgi:sulfopyruvate decarboxylase subunit beta